MDARKTKISNVISEAQGKHDKLLRRCAALKESHEE